MGERMKGTAAPLSESMDEAIVATEAAAVIATERRQLQTLEVFADENQALCELLLELPDIVAYNVMVPFGDAAFMPGRLIHTNELLVLLGDGHYAERSAKQAAEILMRCSMLMEPNINAIRAHIADLEASASFGKDTTAEPAACLADSREEHTKLSVQSIREIVEEYGTVNDTPQGVADADDDVDEQGEANVRAAFRRSHLDDSDKDREANKDEIEEGEINPRYTIPYSRAGGWSEIEYDEARNELQISFVQRRDVGIASPTEPKNRSSGDDAAAATRARERRPSSVSEKACACPQDQLPPRARRPSAAQQ